VRASAAAGLCIVLLRPAAPATRPAATLTPRHAYAPVPSAACRSDSGVFEEGGLVLSKAGCVLPGTGAAEAAGAGARDELIR
jgi:hypothetical protein